MNDADGNATNNGLVSKAAAEAQTVRVSEADNPRKHQSPYRSSCALNGVPR